MQLVFSWAPKLARECESKHWFPCGADGRSFVRSVYGHVITIFSGMGRFSLAMGLRPHAALRTARGAPLIYNVLASEANLRRPWLGK